MKIGPIWTFRLAFCSEDGRGRAEAGRCGFGEAADERGAREGGVSGARGSSKSLKKV